jgi:isopropylmalate/homocitrate/citramalate synthase
MALRTRADYFGVLTGVDATELYRTSRLVADLLGVKVRPQGR